MTLSYDIALYREPVQSVNVISGSHCTFAYPREAMLFKKRRYYHEKEKSGAAAG